MTLVTSLLLAVLPQVHPAPIKLPPRSAAETNAPEVRPISEIERFRRDIAALQNAPARLEEGLRALGETYRAIDSLVVEVARSARATEMSNLMPVARRYGAMQGSRIADELLFQLLARPLGDATRDVVGTLTELKGTEAKAPLKELLRGRIAAARRYAADNLAPMLTADDLDFAIDLTREQVLDLQLRGVELLGHLPEPRSVQRLIELLSKDPAIAGSACATIVQMGQPAVAALQKVCGEPPVDRSFAYCAFALAEIGRANASLLVPVAASDALTHRLQDVDPLTRQLAAVPLTDLVFSAGSTMATPAPDLDLVDTLLDVVQPLRFVPNLDMLRRPAEQRLQLITGRVAAADAVSWREWWKAQRPDFVGLRANVTVSAEEAEHAVVVWRREQRQVRLIAEGLADVPPISGVTEIVLTTQQMLDLVRGLEAGGFGDAERMQVQSGLPIARSLQIQTRHGRAQVAVPLSPMPAFDALVAMVEQQIDAELWQLYRDVTDEPDRGAFWRAERRWLEANPDGTERGRRFARRVVRYWPRLGASLRARAIENLLERPDRSKLFGEADGDNILAALEQVPELGDLDVRLLELAAAVPGDQVWRRCVDFAVRAKGGGHQVVRSVFKVLGPDAVLAALDDKNPLVRRAAVEEVVAVNDLRASDRLVQLLGDEDVEVRRFAVMACGHLQLAAAAQPIVAAIAAEDTPPAVRQECLRAIGSIGGEYAFPVLQRAMAAPSMEDKEAALRGLGELSDPRAAYLLAELVVVANGKDLGELARFHLQRQGGTRAVPALRAQMEKVQDAGIRQRIVLLLGFYQDPNVVPDLIDLLPKPTLAADVTDLLACTTGIDIATEPDRVATIESWWRRNKNQPQWQWLLDALNAANVPMALKPEHFGPGAGLASVAELSRLLVDLRQPRLWVLTSAVLRLVTKQDFGIVTLTTPEPVRDGIAAHYRLLVETERAAKGR